jgi:hypothetical protein
VQILHHQQQRGLLPQAPQQPQQQLEQPSLGDLAVGIGAVGLTQGGQQAGELWPGGADQLADRAHAGLAEQDPECLHDRAVRQGAVADRHAAAGEHPGSVGGTADLQLSDQACFADAGFAPHEDDGRFGGCGPPPGRIEGLELLDPADEGGARHTAAHLAGIIPRQRREGNGGAKGWATRDGEHAGADLWQMPDSGADATARSCASRRRSVLDQVAGGSRLGAGRGRDP